MRVLGRRVDDATFWAWNGNEDLGYGMYSACWSIALEMGATWPLPGDWLEMIRQAKADIEAGRSEREQAPHKAAA